MNYHPYLSSVANADGHPVTSPDEMSVSVSMIPGMGMAMQAPPILAPYQNVGYFAGFTEPPLSNLPRAPKGRRKSGAGLGPGADQVKHRRTRSGCYMCRTRRVKCDETRPVCDRCKKGNRECVYPDPPAGKGTSAQPGKSKDASSSTQPTSPTSSNDGEDDDFEQDTKLETIQDEEEGQDGSRSGSVSQTSRGPGVTPPNFPFSAGRHHSETPSQDGNSASPSNSAVTARSWASVSQYAQDQPHSLAGRLDLSHLSPEVQGYLRFFVDNITNYHYSQWFDGDDFFKTILPSVAIQFEPLMNAVVAFSAYHVAVRNPNGKLHDFLQYYNRSVTQLLALLKRNETHNIQVLMTILQLATIEDYLGDWVNLMGHQKAACEIMTQIFNPQTIMRSTMGRMCLNWYTRFDTAVGLLGGYATEIPREWFAGMVSFYQNQLELYPEVLRWRFEEQYGRLRLLTFDMSALYSKRAKQEISAEDYNLQHRQILTLIEQWEKHLDPLLMDPRYLFKDFPWRVPNNESIDPYTQGILYDHPFFNSTMVNTEWNAIAMLHKSQIMEVPLEQMYDDLGQHALAICKYFAILEKWPATPPGTLIALQPCLYLASLFLLKYQDHGAWLRRRLALLETSGHIHPRSRREKLAEILGDDSCMHWWLPNDEGFSPVLHSLRSLADERNAKVETVRQENFREMTYLYADLDPTEQA